MRQNNSCFAMETISHEMVLFFLVGCNVTDVAKLGLFIIKNKLYTKIIAFEGLKKGEK